MPRVSGLMSRNEIKFSFSKIVYDGISLLIIFENIEAIKYYSDISNILNLNSPEGTKIVTSSPFFFPSKPSPIGD